MGIGAKALNLENSNKSFFASDLPFQQDDRLINERMGGANTLYVVFDGQENDAIKNPEVLRLIDSTQHFIEQQAGVGKAMSIADLIKRMNQAVSGDVPSAYVLPKDKNLISQYLLLYSMSGSPSDFDLYVDYNYRHASITAFLKNDSSLYIHDLISRVENFVDEHKVPGVKIYYGGSVPQSSALADELVSGKLRNVLQIGLVVTIVSALVFRSIIAGLLVIAPLIITVLVNFGVMGLTGIPLNTPNAISSVMAIGIGADYAIYLLYRIMEEYAVYGNLSSAIESAMKSAGKATLFVGSAIAGGYSVLMFSFGFYIHIWFGILIVLSMLVSMLTSLYLVPSLVLTMSPRFILKPNRNGSRIVTSTVSVLLIVAISFYATRNAHAATMQPSEIMQRNYVVSKFNDTIAEATFKLIHKGGEIRIRKTFGVTKLESNGLDTMRMTRFVSPPDIRNTVTVLLEHSDHEDDIWVYLPALKKVRRLAAANKKDSFFGTDLSYGDVIGHKVEDWNHRLVSEVNDNGKLEYLIESTPKSNDISQQSGYAKRLLWINETSFMAEKIEFYDLQEQLLKTTLFLDSKEIDVRGHRWQAMRVEIQNHQTGHKTEILFDHFSANKGVNDNYFNTRYMEKEL
jgi:outer membrane lipoprotein-sorting protein